MQRILTEDQFRYLLGRSDSEEPPEIPPNYPPLSSWEKLSDANGLVDRWRRSLGRFPSHAPVLYIHVPFCDTICDFCGFYRNVPESRAEVGAFLDDLRREMRLFADAFRGVELRYVCFGGGTPSLLDADEIRTVFRDLRENFVVTERTRIAFEAHPQSLDRPRLEALKSVGAEWLAMGVQSFDGRLLKRLNRIQDRDHTIEMIRLAKEVGIRQIEVDLMFPLAGQTEASFLDDVRLAADLDVERVYLFDFQPKLYVPTSEVKEGSLPPEALDLARAWRRKGLDLLTERGYTICCGHWAFKRDGGDWPYSYDQGEDGTYSILGLGPSAISYMMGGARYRNVCNTASYRSRLSKGALPVEKGVLLGEYDEMANFAILDGMHRGEINAGKFLARFGTKLTEALAPQLAELSRRGVVVPNGESYAVVDRARAASELRRAFWRSSVYRTLERRFGLSDRPDASNAPKTGTLVAPSEPVPTTAAEAPVANRIGPDHECNVGLGCNASCGFCYNPVGSQSWGHRPLRELAAELFAGAKASRVGVLFSGGEPTLHPELATLIGLAARMGYKRVGLQTNGLLAAENGYAESLASAGLTRAAVSIHAGEATAHDALTGVAGSFARAARSAERFRDLGLETEISFVLSRRNVDELAGFVAAFSGRGFARLSVSLVRQQGALGEGRAAGWELPWENALPALRGALASARARGTELQCLNIPPCVLGSEYVDLVADMYHSGDALSGDARHSTGSDRVKIPACLLCRYVLRCPGPRPEHLAAFGESAIVPFEAVELPARLS